MPKPWLMPGAELHWELVNSYSSVSARAGYRRVQAGIHLPQGRERAGGSPICYPLPTRMVYGRGVLVPFLPPGYAGLSSSRGMPDPPLSRGMPGPSSPGYARLSSAGYAGLPPTTGVCQTSTTGVCRLYATRPCPLYGALRAVPAPLR